MNDSEGTRQNGPVTAGEGVPLFCSRNEGHIPSESFILHFNIFYQLTCVGLTYLFIRKLLIFSDKVLTLLTLLISAFLIPITPLDLLNPTSWLYGTFYYQFYNFVVSMVASNPTSQLTSLSPCL
ncbi:hypothetical protein ACTA71_011161 [Dictyostelium dimigraforme]